MTESPLATVPYLTPAECDVVQLVAAGYETAEVGRRLSRSYHTVKSELGRAMERLGARNRTQLVALSIAHDLIPTEAYAGRDW